MPLLVHEKVICSLCNYQLPATNYHTEINNSLSQIFWGRAPIFQVAALYYFHKGSKVQTLIHQFKYQGYIEIGQYLGKMYGQQLINTLAFRKIDIIIPVPLHPKKKRKRGYNQSEIFARGLSESMKIAVDTKTLIRKIASASQTKKTRYKRWENVKEIFMIQNYNHLENKHLLLVDDVLTTGSTIEACANELDRIAGVTISVVTIACARL